MVQVRAAAQLQGRGGPRPAGVLPAVPRSSRGALTPGAAQGKPKAIVHGEHAHGGGPRAGRATRARWRQACGGVGVLPRGHAQHGAGRGPHAPHDLGPAGGHAPAAGPARGRRRLCLHQCAGARVPHPGGPPARAAGQADQPAGHRQPEARHPGQQDAPARRPGHAPGRAANAGRPGGGHAQGPGKGGPRRPGRPAQLRWASLRCRPRGASWRARCARPTRQTRRCAPGCPRAR